MLKLRAVSVLSVWVLFPVMAEQLPRTVFVGCWLVLFRRGRSCSRPLRSAAALTPRARRWLTDNRHILLRMLPQVPKPRSNMFKGYISTPLDTLTLSPCNIIHQQCPSCATEVTPRDGAEGLGSRRIPAYSQQPSQIVPSSTSPSSV